MAKKQYTETLLRVENLCQYFGSLKAVDGVSFDIKKGEVFGLVGESGCGKTTTGRSIIKLYDITSGNVYFKGRRIAAGIGSYKNAIVDARLQAKSRIEALKKEESLDEDSRKAQIAQIRSDLKAFVLEQKALIKAARHDHFHCEEDYFKDMSEELQKQKEAGSITDQEYAKQLEELKRQKLVTRIQMIFQDPIASLDPRMTVAETISEGLQIQGIKDKEYIQEEVYKVLEKVGLVREHATRYPHEFSGGQRQRIGVARSVIMKPELIIADEPVSALDVSVQAQVINLLNDLRDEMGLTILFIAHDLSVVKYFSDRIGVMYYGHLVELADSDELFLHPWHPYTKSLLSAIPLPDPEYEKQRKRIVYDPLREHDYSKQEPTLREIVPGHFVRLNDEEEARLRLEIAKEQ